MRRTLYVSRVDEYYFKLKCAMMYKPTDDIARQYQTDASRSDSTVAKVAGDA